MNNCLPSIESGLTLQILRSLLFIPVNEAVSMFPNMYQQEWEDYESGRSAVPPHVLEKLNRLYAWRCNQMVMIRQLLQDNPNAALCEFWPATMNDWMAIEEREPEHFRACQSLYAALISEFPQRFKLYPFDLQAFTKWVGGRAATDALQAQYLGFMTQPRALAK